MHKKAVKTKDIMPHVCISLVVLVHKDSAPKNLFLVVGVSAYLKMFACSVSQASVVGCDVVCTVVCVCIFVHAPSPSLSSAA